MKIYRSLSGILMVCLTACVLCSCSRSPRIAFYTLSSETKPDPSAAGGAFYSIVVGPVSIPELYDRPQLVTRVDSNRVEILENHQWASPLKGEISRTIANDLALLLKSSRVAVYPWNTESDTDIRVWIDIQRFDMTAGKGVDLEASWILKRNGGVPPRHGKTVAHEAVGGMGNDLLVAAHGRVLAAVSRDIAEALRSEKSTAN
jgi:uncharacterized lipoprotein YmbA